MEYIKIENHGRVWWGVPVIPALRRLRQEDGELEASLGCTVRLCLKKFWKGAGRPWLTPVILTSWETDIGKIEFPDSLGK
jgi:hypothetical protein